MERPKRQSHRLRELIDERGVRYATLAAACGVDQSTITRWRDGKSVIPSNHLPTLASELGVSVGELMGWPKDVVA